MRTLHARVVIVVLTGGGIIAASATAANAGASVPSQPAVTARALEF